MQVSGVEVPQQSSGEKTTAQPQQPSGGIFDAFLKSAIGSAYSALRLDSGTEIGQKIVAEAPSQTPEDKLQPRALEENAERTGVEDSDSDDAYGTDVAYDTDVASSNNSSEERDADVAAAANLAKADAENTLGTNVPEQIVQIAIAATSPLQNTTVRGNSEKTQQASPLSKTAATQNVPDDDGLNSNNGPQKAKPIGPQRLTAQVSEAPQKLVSRPSTNLAAAVTVATQAEKQRAEGSRVGGSTDKASDNTGNLLLNDGANKPDRSRTALRLATQTAANATQVKTGELGPAPNPQGAGFGAILAQNRPGAATVTTGNGTANLMRGAESLPLNSGTGLANGSTSPTTVSRPTSPPLPPNIQSRALTGQIAVQIQKSVAQGLDQIKIQLKPAELGRVEIKLDVMQDGRVAATIIADRPETLELLQRDARGLQQALQDAGLKSDAANLSFNLGGGNASDEQQAAEEGATENRQDGEALETVAETETETPRRRAGNGMIDVEV